ncbi:MAG: enoyl-CoA hydratase [Pseudomonadota bacterium]
MNTPATDNDADNILLLTRPQDGCACLTLNRPQAMNALSLALRRALVRTLDTLAQDDSVRVLVLTGAGRAFCAGLDLREIDPGAITGDTGTDVATALANFPRPVIGAVNGAAITGGLEVALACDLLIASSEARFADTHARIGVIPGWGLSQRLSRLIGIARAKEMAFSGNFVGAEQAERWGLVNRVTAPEQLMPQALALAADIASALPEMLPIYKRLIDDGHARSFAEGMALEQAATRDWAASLTPEVLRARREAVQARGRAQKG